MLLSVCACTHGAGDGTDSAAESGTDLPETEEVVDISSSVTVTADFDLIIDPPFLKKVAMYNAGCIQPLSNYERDMDRATDLNVDALRIDLSAGKSNGTAGQYLVSDDYDYYDYDEKTGTFKVDVSSLKYDFRQLDSVVALMNKYDVRPYMSWCYIPYPLQENGKWNNLDRNVTNWKDVWEEVYYQYAKHYVDAGVRIGYHEIYNEPDLEILKCWGVFDETFDGFLNWNDFCLGSACAPGNGVYPDMYAYGVRGILRADPYATVGGPAFALGEIGVESWVGFLPRVIEDNLPLDFYSFHTYLDGNTWFMSDAERRSGGKNEIEKVVAGLAANKHFLKTAVHINEFSPQNETNGSTNGLGSSFNYYAGAWQTFDGLMEAVDRTSIQWIYWAQFMESTGGYDPYGIIEHVNGHVKAAYNALKIYADMPVWRYDASLSDENAGLRAYVSASDDKIGVVLYNVNPASEDSADGDRTVNVVLKNAPFADGVRRVYRIDGEHASYFDKTESDELTASLEKTVSTNGSVFAGTIPADGMIYITINKDGKADFTAYEDRTDFATDVKTQYYYEDRYRGLEGSREEYEDYTAGISGSYAHYDRGSNTMYLGMGDSTGKDGQFVGQAHANGAILFENLPEKFHIDVKTDGEIGMNTKQTTLGVRIDFMDGATGAYTKSVYFYLDDLYRDSRDPNSQDKKLAGLPAYPWGTQKAPDTAVSCTGSTWDVDLTKYAPEGWNAATDKAQISFDMQNTGANTRAAITLRK